MPDAMSCARCAAGALTRVSVGAAGALRVVHPVVSSSMHRMARADVLWLLTAGNAESISQSPFVIDPPKRHHVSRPGLVIFRRVWSSCGVWMASADGTLANDSRWVEHFGRRCGNRSAR